MTARRDLLVEIGTEELPPKSLKQMGESLAEEIHAGLVSHNLNHADYQWHATPRRLAVIVKRVVTRQADQEMVRRGPALNAAYDKKGRPTKAAEGFARSCNVSIEDLETEDTGKGKRLMYRTTVKGRDTAELIPEITHNALTGMSIPKRMRWGEGAAEFVRPVHWIVILLGRDIIPCRLLETEAGNESRGHRFHAHKAIKIPSATTYAKKLKEKGYVIVDFNARREIIRNQVIDKAHELGGHAWLEDDLLDEVASLVEWPVVISGSFDKAFLELPREVLIATMQDHQKYFPVTDETGQKIHQHFITVANIESRNPDEISRGNEKVLRPRLADAVFFWRRDCATPLEGLRSNLKNVVFQQQLGTLQDKTERISNLALYIAAELEQDKTAVKRAASLAKCDLFTEMVGEFPELQGVMGRYYALKSGESEEVALALQEQYMPRYAGDAIPASPTGRVLAIAEKLDTLTGIFAVGQSPTGDSDPFGLRRSALGCIRIMIEGGIDLDLEQCLQVAARNLDNDLNAKTVIHDVYDFMMERLRRYYLDMNIRADVFESVLARRPVRPLDFDRRIHAVAAFTHLPEAKSLASANKRIRNILRQSDQVSSAGINKELLHEPSEKALAMALEKTRETVHPLLETCNYDRALSELALLRDTVDTFFDNVMVMTDDASLKLNRIAILQQLSELFLSIADISRLQSES